MAPGDDAPITEQRNTTLTHIAGKLRNAGLSPAALEVALLQVNADRCQPPMDDEEVIRIAANVGRYALASEVGVTVGAGKPVAALAAAEPIDPSTWPSLFHSRDETVNQPDPKFLIEGFLQEQSIMGLIGPARARKSIVTLNVIHSLLTGDKLFGHFEVKERTERVVYLCPETGLMSLARRIRNMGPRPVRWRPVLLHVHE